MSTKMSTDLNINRPSSRVTRAPGGASTISFGSEEPPKPPAVANSPVKPKQETVTPPPVPETPAKVTKAAVKGKVVVLVAGNVEPDFYVEAVVKALAVEGIKGAVVSKIPDVGALAYAAQTLAKSADVVIAGAILSDFHADQVATLNNALLQAGLNNKPIIPAFIARPSLLEAKVALADTASEWAQSVVTVLSLKNLETAPAPEVVIKEKPVLTPTVTSVDTLLDIFRESLRARGASGIFGLSRKFKIIDDNNNGQLDLKEFTKAIGEHALGWSAAQIKADDDKEAILANLKEQGIDVDVVELSNGTKIKANEPAPPAPVKANPQETPLGRPAASFNPRRQPGGVSTFTLG
eukprot:gene6183-6818_t